jgi:ribosomal protein S24E
LSALEVIQDSENKLLSRRELKVRFRAGNGILTRQAATEAIASKVGVNKENVKVISLKGRFGNRDADATVYIFSKPLDDKNQLAEYVLLRHLSKEDRKKVREDKRKAAATPATAAGGATAPASKS